MYVTNSVHDPAVIVDQLAPGVAATYTWPAEELTL